MGPCVISDPELFALLRLTLTKGLGPVLIRRLVARFGGAVRATICSAADLQQIEGIGQAKARTIAEGLAASQGPAEQEWNLCEKLGVRLVGIAGSANAYPKLLAPLPDAPVLLYMKGAFDPQRDQFAVGIVGSRSCTTYGLEQAGRFARTLAGAGLTIVSGGATGIDTAAHQAALDASAEGGGRTIAVLGCGLAKCYPPQNQGLFDRIASSGQGVLVSELPLMTPPAAENFPARNRIISGLSLGIVLIEAARGSGALITAKCAAEDHGREVLVLPGRVDSPSIAGSLDLLKEGGGLLVTEPGDVIHALEGGARHIAADSHAARFGGIARPSESGSLFANEPTRRELPMSDAQRAIMNALQDPATIDDLALRTNLPIGQLRGELTMLEIQKRVSRRGTVFTRV